MSDLFQVVFEWPHPEPSDVIVTGSFDNWAAKQHLTKTATGFEAKVGVPWGVKIYYKYVVDGTWQPHEDQPTEPDHDGNINNWLIIPPKPAEPAPALSLPETAVVTAVGAIAAATTAVKEAAAPIVQAVTNSIPTTNGVKDDLNAAPAAADEVSPKDAPKEDTMTSDIDLKPSADMVPEAVVPATPEVIAPTVPMAIEPVADATNDTTTETKAPTETPAVEQPSTHTPAPATMAPEPEKPATPAEEPKPAVAEPVAVMEPAPAMSTEAPVTEPMTSTPPPATPEKPHTNGTTPIATPTSTAPTTPSKKPFPSVDDDTGSMTSSKGGSVRKKRTSIFGKLKHMFHHHEKGEKAKEASH